MKEYKTIVFLKLDPEKAKEKNLPVKLPLLLDDFLKASKRNEISIESVIRGLEAALDVGEDREYYTSYLVYAYYEKFKACTSKSDPLQLHECEEWLEKARNLHYDYRYHFYKGILRKKMGRLEEAELELKKASSMARQFYPVWFELGRLYLERGEHEEALESFQQALKIEPSFLPAALGIADVYAVKGLHDESIEMLKSILSADPNFLPALERLGAIYNASQRFRSAKTLLERAVSLAPMRWDIHYNLAHTLSRLGEHVEALHHLRRAAAINSSPEVLNELMLQQRNVGLFEEAIDTAVKLLTREDTPSHFRVNAMKTLYYAGEWELFWQFFEKFQTEEILELAVMVCLESGQLEKARHLHNRLRTPSALIATLMEQANDALNWNPAHEVNIESFVRKLMMEEPPPQMRKRLYHLVEGRIPETAFHHPWKIGKLLHEIYSPAPSFSCAYRNTTKLFFALFGGGEALAFGRAVYRIYQRFFARVGFSLEAFVDDVIEELKDLSWKTAVALARMVEEKNVDPEEASERKIKDFTQLTTGLLTLIASEWNEEVKDANLREAFEEVKEWSTLTGKSFSRNS